MANQQHGAPESFADGDNVGCVITPFKDVKLPQQHYDSTTTKKTTIDSSSSSKLSISRRSSSSTATKQTRSITSSTSCGSVSCCSDDDDNDECSRSYYHDDESYRTYLDDDSSYASDYSRRSSWRSSTSSDDDDRSRMSKRQLLKLLKLQSKRLEVLELENSHLKQSQQELLQVQRDVMEVQIVELANRNDELLLQIEERDLRLAYQQKQFQRQHHDLLFQLSQTQQQKQEQQHCACSCNTCDHDEEVTPQVANETDENTITKRNNNKSDVPLKVDNSNHQDSDDSNDRTSSPKRIIMKERCYRGTVQNIPSSQIRKNKDKQKSGYKEKDNEDVVAQALDELRHEIIQLQKEKIVSQKEFKRKLASSWHQTELSKRQVEALETKLLQCRDREKDMSNVIAMMQHKLERQTVSSAATAGTSSFQSQKQLQERSLHHQAGTVTTRTSSSSSVSVSLPLTSKLGGPSLLGRPRLSARHTSTSSSDTVSTLEDSYLNTGSSSFFENARSTFSSFLS